MPSIDIYCINLISRKDRKDRVSAMFKKLGIMDSVQWLHVEKSPEGGRVGCFESHVKCLSASTADIVIVFEDDAVIGQGVSWDSLKNIILNKLKIYNFFSIGCIIYPLQIGYDRMKLKVKSDVSCITTTCYAITQKCIKRTLPLLKKIIKNKTLRNCTIMHIDACLNCIIPNKDKVGFIRPVIIQYDMLDTDNSWFSNSQTNSIWMKKVPSFMETSSRYMVNKIFKNMPISKYEVYISNISHNIHMFLVRKMLRTYSALRK